MTPSPSSGRTIVIPAAAVTYRTSRSSGPGGQNVNKLDTRVEAIVDLDAVGDLTPSERETVRTRCRSRIDRAGCLRVVSQRSRSQWQNRQLALERATELIQSALTPVTPRVATRPTRSSRLRRVDTKRRRSTLKAARRRPRDDDA